MNIMPPMLLRGFLAKNLAGLLVLALVGSFITCLSICSEHQQTKNSDSFIQTLGAITDSCCEQECPVESSPGVLPGKQTITSIPTAQAYVFISPRLNGSNIGQPSKPAPSSHFTHDPTLKRLSVIRI
jgi:hypothetical protein